MSTNETDCQTEPIYSAYFHGIYKAVRHQVFSNRDLKVLWNDTVSILDVRTSVLMGLFHEKADSALTFSEYIYYPIHAILLNVSPTKRELLINNAYKTICLLPISVHESDFDEDEPVYDTHATETDYSVVQDSLDD